MDAGGTFAGHADMDVGFSQRPADRSTRAAALATLETLNATSTGTDGISGEGYHSHFAFVCRLYGGQHGRRLAARAETQQHVAGLAQRTHLAREHIALRRIGTVRTGIRHVGGQCQGRKFRPLALEAADEMCSELLRQHTRNTRPAGQYLAAAGDAHQHRLHGLRERLAQHRSGLVLEVCAVDEVLLDPLLKHGARS